MSIWRRFHQNETITAMAISDNRRFFARVREPQRENRRPLEFCRWRLQDAQDAADRVVQLYYPHECDEQTCGTWRKSDN